MMQLRDDLSWEARRDKRTFNDGWLRIQYYIQYSFIRGARERADLPITWLQQSDTCGYLGGRCISAQGDLWNDT
jgi:hypothetical protein